VTAARDASVLPGSFRITAMADRYGVRWKERWRLSESTALRLIVQIEVSNFHAAVVSQSTPWTTPIPSVARPFISSSSMRPQ
jgi:hypothetical protein